MENKERTKFIENALKKYRGAMMPWLQFKSDELPFVEYYYDERDDSLHAGPISIPFHYSESEVNGEVIDDCLEKLQEMVYEHYIRIGVQLEYWDVYD